MSGLVTVALAACSTQSSPTSQNAGPTTVLLRDDFVHGVDSSEWEVQNRVNSRPTDQARQTPSGATTGSHGLSLIAVHDAAGWLGGELDSRHLFRYGTFTARIRFPRTPADGIWPAFWLVNMRKHGEAPQEVDIAEWLGNHPSSFRCNYIWGYAGPGEQTQSTVKTGMDLSRGWHDYSLRWTADRLTWSLDGRQVKTWSAADASAAGVHLPDAHLMVILGIGVGKAGGLAGAPDNLTRLPASFDVRSLTITG